MIRLPSVPPIVRFWKSSWSLLETQLHHTPEDTSKEGIYFEGSSGENSETTLDDPLLDAFLDDGRRFDVNRLRCGQDCDGCRMRDQSDMSPKLSAGKFVELSAKVSVLDSTRKALVDLQPRNY